MEGCKPWQVAEIEVFGGFFQTRLNAEKQKVNLNWLTFNYFVDQTLRISNLSFIEGLVQLQSFIEACQSFVPAPE